MTIFIVLSSVANPLLAQVSERTLLERGTILVKISPLSMINVAFPLVEGGVSYMLTDEYNLQVKAGKKVDLYNPDDIYRHSGYRVAVECQKTWRRKVYLALEVGAMRNKFSDAMVFMPTRDLPALITDEYSVVDAKLYIVPKAGLKLFITRRMTIDVYAGLGVEHHRRDVYDLLFDESAGNYDPNDYEWFGPTYTEQNHFKPRLALGLNLNFRIN